MKYQSLREIIDKKIEEGYEVKSLLNGCVQMARGTNKIEVAPTKGDRYIVRNL